MLKGGSRSLAEDLRLKEQNKYMSKLEERKLAASKRMEELAMNELEKQKKKDDIKAKKASLMMVQDQDAMAKQ